VEFAAFENLKRLEASNFFKNSRLSPTNPDDPDSFKVRRGKVGGYLDYFDERQIAEMEDRVRSQLSPVFGYSEPLDREAPSVDSTTAGAPGPASAAPVGAR
jgi:hypothetical protein